MLVFTLLTCVITLESEVLAWCGSGSQACDKVAHAIAAAGYSVGCPGFLVRSSVVQRGICIMSACLMQWRYCGQFSCCSPVVSKALHNSVAKYQEEVACPCSMRLCKVVVVSLLCVWRKGKKRCAPWELEVEPARPYVCGSVLLEVAPKSMAVEPSHHSCTACAVLPAWLVCWGVL